MDYIPAVMREPKSTLSICSPLVFLWVSARACSLFIYAGRCAEGARIGQPCAAPVCSAGFHHCHVALCSEHVVNTLLWSLASINAAYQVVIYDPVTTENIDGDGKRIK